MLDRSIARRRRLLSRFGGSSVILAARNGIIMLDSIR
jgi:hypothetical protein